MRKITTILLTAAVIIGFMAGCSKSGASTEDAVSSGDDGGVYVQEVINVGIDGDPTDMDPFTALQFKNGTAHPLFLQTLGYMNSNGTYSGVMMKSYELPDTRTINVELFDMIKDQAGNDFTADDAIWCIDQHLSTQNVYASSVESAEKTGDYSFTIHFNHDIFVNDLTDVLTNLFFVTKAAYETSPDNMVTDPVSTAPYKVTKYVTGSQLVLEKWDDYWKPEELPRTPVEEQNVETIVYHMIMEHSQMSIALETGAIDIAQNIGLDDLAFFRGNDDFKIYTLQEGLNNVLYPNTDANSPCSDQRVREAIYYALDGQAIVKKMFGDSAVPSKCVGNTAYSDYIDSWADGDYWSYNPERAKALLIEAGYSEDNPLHLDMLVMEHPTFKGIMEIVQSYLTAVGIDADLSAVNGGSYFADSSDPSKWDLQHSFANSNDFIVSAWSNLAESYSDHGPLNFARDAKLDDLIKTARSIATHDQETVAAAQEYMNSKAYAYGVSANYVNIVYASWFETLGLNDHRWITPGASVYARH